MIDRLEILSNGFINPKALGGVESKKKIDDSWNKAELEKLFEETDFNFLIKSEGFIYDAVYKLQFFERPFLIFTGRHFKRQPLIKIVINPNYFEKKLLEELISIYFIQFYPAKVGRIDYNIDLDIDLWNIARGILFERKRKAVTVREFHKKDLETLYIGAGDFMIRIYDKVKECRQRPKQETAKKVMDYFNKNNIDKITRVEFQIRGKNAGFNLQDLFDGNIDLSFLDDIQFFRVPGSDGSFRNFGIAEYIDKFGMQATYQKMDRKKRKEWIEKRFTWIDINDQLKRLLYKEILTWIDGKYVFKVHKIAGN